MNFEPTEERRMISDALDRLLAEHCDIGARDAAAFEAPYSNAAAWQALSEMGAFAALADESAGGLGGDGFDIACVFERLGRALCSEPVLPQLMAIRLLAASGAAELEAAISGETRCALAFDEADAWFELERIDTRAEAADGGYRLNGRKSLVYGGPAATVMLVAATLDGTLALFAVASDGAEQHPYALIDGGGACELLLRDTPATLLLADATDALQDALDAGAIALCAEAVGVMDVLRDTTLEYLGTRKQFGVPIGAFQALQHRFVDLSIEIEQARSITQLAASRLSGDDSARTVSMAKNLVGRTGQLVAEEAIQMHGGIAMTWEYSVSHYAKRLTMIDHQLGDRDQHLYRVMNTLQSAS